MVILCLIFWKPARLFSKVAALFYIPMGLPGSSAGKESACNAGDHGSIPGSGKFAKEGIGYPLQYSWVSLSGSAGKESACNARDLGSILGCEDPREKGTATHSSILAWRISWTTQSMGSQRVRHD